MGLFKNNSGDINILINDSLESKYDEIVRLTYSIKNNRPITIAPKINTNTMQAIIKNQKNRIENFTNKIRSPVNVDF